MKPIMERFGILLVIALFASSPFTGEAGEDGEISRYRWRNRVLLIFTPSWELPAYRTLAEDLKEQHEDVAQTDLVLFTLMGEGQSRVGEEVLSDERAESLRRQFNVNADEFRVVLIGKDGTVKINTDSVRLKDVFAVIDSMPMRQHEMKDSRPGGTRSQ